MKVFNLVLLVALFYANVFTASSNPLNAISSLIQNLIHHGPVCRPLNYAALVPGNVKGSLSVSIPFGAIANGNDVYISGYGDGNVNRYNNEGGNGVAALETNTLAANGPAFMDIKDSLLYVTHSGSNAVYRKPLIGGEFTQVLNVNAPVGIKWSPNGERLLVGEWNTGIIHVYDKDFQEITTFNAQCDTYAREISFDLDGNIRITAFNNRFCLYSKDDYSILPAIPITDAVNSNGHLQHCDGTIILADGSGKVLFLDENYKTLRSLSGFTLPTDVALAADGTLYVTDYGANTVYLYSLYDEE